MKHYIKGKYKRSIFESNNGYVIGLIKVKETNDENLENFIDKTITFTGYFADIKEEDDYIFYGELVNHPKYGMQYNVLEYNYITPSDEDGIITFLSSDLFTGIGEKLATRIVNTLGKNALDKILEDKNVLCKVPKISEKKINLIYDILTKYEESHKIVVYLTELGFTMKDSLSIYNRYKSDTIPTIKNNIYDLYFDMDISFLKIDNIAKKLKFNFDDNRRVKGCIIYIMKNLSFELGDTYLEYNDIYINTINYLKFNIDKEEFTNLLDELRYEGLIALLNDNYYLKEIYESEEEILNKIKIISNIDPIKYKNFDKYLKNMQEVFNITYNKKQQEAIKKALENNLLIINGGPGTGKTTIIKAIVDMYKELNGLSYEETLMHIALLAPTGRASKRMSEATYFPATTIHRFLKWDKESNSFNVDEYNKSDVKFVIVDEVSMIDINLLASLFKGLKDNIKLVLVGDYNQLPSVGPGNVLKDLIESKVIDVIELNTLYRQTDDSYINKLAIEIKENNLTNYLDSKDDYVFLKCNNFDIKENIKNIAIKLKDYDLKNIQFMAPMYGSINGIDNLNKELQKILNPEDSKKEEIKYGDVIFRENDKVLQLVNMPDENVFNGDVGIIRNIVYANKSESKKDEIYVDYDGMIVKYLPKDFINIKHAFIISIHKSQGSEFDTVIIPISMEYKRMLFRKLIYTAVTRAKRKLILVGEDKAFLYSVSNNNERVRKTNLKDRLYNMYN